MSMSSAARDAPLIEAVAVIVSKELPVYKRTVLNARPIGHTCSFRPAKQRRGNSGHLFVLFSEPPSTDRTALHTCNQPFDYDLV